VLAEEPGVPGDVAGAAAAAAAQRQSPQTARSRSEPRRSDGFSPATTMDACTIGPVFSLMLGVRRPVSTTWTSSPVKRLGPSQTIAEEGVTASLAPRR
jgi:hypothetical protein